MCHCQSTSLAAYHLGNDIKIAVLQTQTKITESSSKLVFARAALVSCVVSCSLTSASIPNAQAEKFAQFLQELCRDALLETEGHNCRRICTFEPPQARPFNSSSIRRLMSACGADKSIYIEKTIQSLPFDRHICIKTTS